LLGILSIWLVCGCKTMPEVSPIAQAEITYLDMGGQAPFSGYLLTPYMLSLLYRDARQSLAGDVIMDIRERYGTEAKE